MSTQQAPSKNPLSISDLRIDIATEAGVVEPVRGVSLEVRDGEILAIVGESGSGKTLTARAILGLFPRRSSANGSVDLNGQNVLEASGTELRALRGGGAAMIFQEPSTALNPVFTIGWQIEEGLRAHGMSDRKQRRERVLEVLRAVGLPHPERRVHDYPHQFSGGQKQRIVIAMALALRPRLLVADEPTTALDVTVQAEILELLRTLRDELGTAIVLITHNMGVVADLADRVAVMYRGELIEEAPVEELFASPREEYTRALLAAVPRFGAGARQKATADAAILSQPREALREDSGPKTGPLVEVTGLNVIYRGGFRKPSLHAVRDVSLSIGSSEVLGLVGESGSGKSTIGRTIAGLEPIASGSIRVLGRELGEAKGRELRELRRRIGFVFQDPASSFNPFMSIEDCVAEPLRIHGIGTSASRAQRARELLESVELPTSVSQRKPHELSGGQRQRVGLARALALDPELVIADEPTSALDVSVQARVLELFSALQSELGFACLFISHDLAVVEQLADRVGVLRQGELVESGPTQDVLHSPTHEYTRALIAAIPVPDPVVQRARRSSVSASLPQES